MTSEARRIRAIVEGAPEGERLAVALAWIDYLAPGGDAEARALGVRYGLTAQQADILRMLTQRMGVVVPTERLCGLCSDRAANPVRSIEAQITYLRRRLREADADIEVVTALHVGYYARYRDGTPNIVTPRC